MTLRKPEEEECVAIAARSDDDRAEAQEGVGRSGTREQRQEARSNQFSPASTGSSADEDTTGEDQHEAVDPNLVKFNGKTRIIARLSNGLGA